MNFAFDQPLNNNGQNFDNFDQPNPIMATMQGGLGDNDSYTEVAPMND